MNISHQPASTMQGKFLAEIRLEEAHGIDRKQQPVCIGVPLPAGCQDTLAWELVDQSGLAIECQAEVLSRHNSGSASWLKIQFFADLAAGKSNRLYLTTSTADLPIFSPKVINWKSDRLSLKLLDCPETTVSWQVTDASGKNLQSTITPPKVTAGLLSERTLLTGKLGIRSGLNFRVSVEVFPKTGLASLEVTLHNPTRSEHQGGYWDLGDPNSISLQSAYVEVELGIQVQNVTWLDHASNSVPSTLTGSNWKLMQHSSGGANWESRVHLNAQNLVPKRIKGFTLTTGTEEVSGLRATPVVGANSEKHFIAATMLDFWEKFPSEIAVDGSRFKLSIFPATDDLHELLPGEETTRTIWLKLGGQQGDLQKLAALHHPINVLPVYSQADDTALEWSQPTPAASTSDSPVAHTIETYLEEMLSGPRNFLVKREAIDDYGWRNFGDFWADHEETYSDATRPVISHYNNQYDLLYGLLRQYLRSGDLRWWEYARPLANHIMDIDIYHTAQDRAAFNGGLFWHTAHYQDAGTAGHRTFSRLMTGEKHRVVGGGPSNEHNYSSGLMLFYWLTGNKRAKRSVISLADWVIAMDDGNVGVLAPLSGSRTGNASSTSQGNYHGPGRGVGNSINSLNDAWLLTRKQRYLDKCHELIKRCFHPDDNLERHELTHAELRWSYPVALQALLRHLFFLNSENLDHEISAYIRACLAKYGKWMFENERLFSADKSQLEFPTETWPAQDLRKGSTLMLLSNYAPTTKQNDWHGRGAELFQSALEELVSYETRCFTRPVALALQQIPIAEFAFQAPSGQEPTDHTNLDWGLWSPFITQKSVIKSNLRSLKGVVSTFARLTNPNRWKFTISQTKIGRLWRQFRK